MVESVGTRVSGVSLGVVRNVSETPSSTAAAVSAVSATPAVAPSIGQLAKDMAAAPPVNTDRVAEIKQAIKDGRYPIMPARIADSLIALRLEWKSN
jgi:negative regulator of flagellin synthesis FlgM